MAVPLTVTTSIPPAQIPSINGGIHTTTINESLTNHHHHHHHHRCRLLSLLNSSCPNMSHLKQIHAQTLRTTTTTIDYETFFLYSRILHFSSLSNLNYSFNFFNQIENPNSFMWNTLIKACAKSTDRKNEAMDLYFKMMNGGLVLPDKHTFPFVLKACAYLFALSEGKQIHAHVVKLGFGSDVYVNNSLIHFYSSCGQLNYAKKVFDEMSERSVVSWNVMIDGYVQVGEFGLGLKLFCEIQKLFDPDGYTLQSVISACSGLGSLFFGLWAHAYVLRNNICDGDDVNTDVLVYTSLVDMYCKCGSLRLARQVFDGMRKRDVTSWNAMILGFAMHGKANLALDYFTRMIRIERLTPNSITFVGILSACNHRGMVDKGKEYFDTMIEEYKIKPELEHYGCLVDLLARAGLINDALDLVSKMPMKPDIVIWRSLLDACCKKNAGIELSEEMAKQILESEGNTGSAVYVLLSRVYASASQWNDVGSVRKLMTDRGVTKEPGCSSIEIDGFAHEFFAGDTSHPQTKELYKFLDVIEKKLESVGYKPDLSQASMVDEPSDGKEQALKLQPEAKIGLASGISAFLWLYVNIQGYKPATIVITSDLPLGSGLGSSAAFCVSIAAAMLALSDAVSLDLGHKGWLTFGDNDLYLLNKWAFEGEKIIHGKPSGIDNTVSTYGNMIKFKSGSLTRMKSNMPLKMLITNTKVGRNTKALVAGVSERALRYSQAMTSVFDAVDSISNELAAVIQSPATDDEKIITEKEEKLEELMEMNQGLLQCMGVSHASIETVLRTTLKYKLASKLTGAGGGGCVLTLIPTLLSRTIMDKVIAELESCGFQCLTAGIGGNGLEICFDGSS